MCRRYTDSGAQCLCTETGLTVNYNLTTNASMTDDTIHPTSVRITPEVREALKRLAKADGRSLTNYIGRVLAQHVEHASKRGASPKSRK
jgi:hypothetical protein